MPGGPTLKALAAQARREVGHLEDGTLLRVLQWVDDDWESHDHDRQLVALLREATAECLRRGR